ncbi:MAG: hypothetical protein BWY71_01653 [Planctomycetes bacterium ADurb.Bin412]|nr:MAG: hypothetical protein BWY71_01653 [Planctomycetes bacterium ADurb.Bin412]
MDGQVLHLAQPNASEQAQVTVISAADGQAGNRMAIAVEMTGKGNAFEVFLIIVRADHRIGSNGSLGEGGTGEVQVDIQPQVIVPKPGIGADRVKIGPGVDDEGVGTGAAAGQGVVGIIGLPGEHGIAVGVAGGMGHLPDIRRAVISLTDKIPAGTGEGGLGPHLIVGQAGPCETSGLGAGFHIPKTTDEGRFPDNFAHQSALVAQTIDLTGRITIGGGIRRGIA